MIGWVILLAASASNAVPEGERQFLMHVKEDPRIRVESTVIEGRLCAERYTAFDCNFPVRVSIRLNGDFIEIASSAGSRPLSVEIPLSRVPDLDLQSAEMNGHYRPSTLVIVELRFGEPNSCFVNDDGRSRLSVSLGEDRGARAWITTHEGCEIQNEQIVGAAPED